MSAYYWDFARNSSSLKNCMVWSIENRFLYDHKNLIILAKLSKTTTLNNEICRNHVVKKFRFCFFCVLSNLGDLISFLRDQPNATTRQLKQLFSLQKSAESKHSIPQNRYIFWLRQESIFDAPQQAVFGRLWYFGKVSVVRRPPKVQKKQIIVSPLLRSIFEFDRGQPIN